MERATMLEKIYDDRRKELEFRRSREQQIFTWSATIFLALIGGALLSPKKDNLLARLEPWHALVAGFSVLTFAIFCAYWLYHQRLGVRENQRVLAAVPIERGWFDLRGTTGDTSPIGTSILPEKWKDWGHVESNHLSGLGKLASVLVLGIVASIVVWFALR
jgi:hypothetical protein